MVVLDELRRIYHATNDLSRLIPVGIVSLVGVPAGFDYNGLPAEKSENISSKWQWLDVNMLPHDFYNSTNDVVRDLRFLVTYKYFMGTYKMVNMGDLRLCKIRLYAVPSDRPFSRTIERWRSMFRGNSTFQKTFVKSWSRVANVADFSQDQWHAELVVVPTILVPVSTSLTLPTTTSNYHMERWRNRWPFSFPLPLKNIESLQSQLQQLYSSIKSPNLSKYRKVVQVPSNQPPSHEQTIAKLVKAAEDGPVSVPGVKSALYPFQVRSLCKMYEKESEPSVDTLPSFIEIESPVNQKIYYFDCLTNKFCLEPDVFSLPRGGILAENMGLGKTLICLSLISLTKHEITKVPEDVMVYEDESDGQISLIRSLVEISRDTVNMSSIPWKYYWDDLPPSVIDYMNSVPGSFKISLFDTTSTISNRMTRNETYRQETLDSNTHGEGIVYKTLYKSSTTLVVVPDNLFHQWNDEMKLHLHQSYLKVLFVLSQFQKKHVTTLATFQNQIPSDPLQLLSYDMILISSSVLARLLDVMETEENPIFKVYWKRLIVDEGHSMNSKNSRVSQLCKELYAERRWAVTGTPTSGMTRLQMDEEEGDNDTLASPTKKNKYTVKNKFNAKEDLSKLGVTIGSFLKVEPFHSQPKYWASSVIKPMISNNSQSRVSLYQLLNALVVRHDLREVEREVELPPLRHVPVFLEPSFHNTLSINLFTAVLAVNAVTSERTDSDYMFHPSNRQQLRRLVTNMQRATFHWTGFKPDDIKTLMDICKTALSKTTETSSKSYNIEDTRLLEKSLDISRKALSNGRWRALALLHEMCYYVEGLPDIFTKVFGTGVVERLDINGEEDDISVFGAPHLHCVQEFFYKNRFMDFANLGMVEEKLEVLAKPFWENYWVDVAKRNSERFNKLDANQHFKVMNDLTNTFSGSLNGNALKPTSPSRKKNQLNQNLEKAQLRPEDKILEARKVHSSISNDQPNLNFGHIKRARILGTASSKLSYLGARLLENRREGVKSLVFFEFEDSAYYLSELLDVMGVEYILYATFINPAERATNLTKFSTFPQGPENGITLIMDINLAAHGLNITAATHVYFTSPVWLRSVEAQAIKRAHRIGQTKAVRVETLILTNTLEEEIYRKRSQETEDNDREQKYVIDDTGMQEFILKHRFLSQLETEPEYSPFVAPLTNSEYRISARSFEDALENHSDLIENGFRRWMVYLFTESNLSKMNSAKNTKLNKKFVRDQFLKRFMEEAPAAEQTIDEKRTQDRAQPSRKKVRF